MRAIFEGIQKIAIFSICVLLLSLHAGSAHALSVDDVGTFQPTSTLPLGSSDSTSAIYNNYIYQVGGATSQYGSSLEVNYAHINSDGSLGEWNSTTPLPNAVYNSATVVYNGYIYEVGGAPNGGNGSSTTVYVAPINNDGTIGEWSTTSALPQQLAGHSALVNDGFIYAIAGHDTTGGFSNKIYYAPINNDGTIGSWSIGATLPDYSFEGTSVVYDDRIYVLGGLGASFEPSANVYIGNINIDGSISSIQTSGNLMPSAVVEGNSVVNNGYIYTIGGGPTFNTEGDEIYYAPINNDGTVGVWQTSSTKLPTPVIKSSSVTNNGYLYSVGGYGNGSLDSVHYAQFITPDSADSDEDGVLDVEENAGPNGGDANNDGTQDSEQPNVLSYENALTNEYAILETDCQSIENFQIGGESSGQSDKNYDYPMGLASFWIRCENPGDTANVKQYFFNNQGSQDYTVRKWMNDGTYVEIPDYEKYGMLLDTPVFGVEYDLTDGSSFDDDGEENGLIIDPSGPALPVGVVDSDSSSTSSSLAETGEDTRWFVYLAATLIATPLIVVNHWHRYRS